MTPVAHHIAAIREAARARRETYPNAEQNCGESLVAEIDRLRAALALIRDFPIREQDDQPAANMRRIASEALDDGR